MKLPRILASLPVAAGTALLLASAPAAAAAPASAPAVTTVTAESSTLTFTPSPILNMYLLGTCEKTVTGSVQIRAMQRINWMWGPMAVDLANGDALAQILIPNTMGPFTSEDIGFRDRHNLTAERYYAPGPAPKSPVSCTFHGWAPDAEFDVTITGTLVTIPKWIDALQPPIQAPAHR